MNTQTIKALTWDLPTWLYELFHCEDSNKGVEYAILTWNDPIISIAVFLFFEK